MKALLGCCYYPEHWPESMWQQDATRMADLGLSLVRIGEFAWSQIEPRPGRYSWCWLDDVLGLLGDAGLQVVLGTPSATPPRWMLEQYPDMLAVDANGNPRGFGSRRHYCFSHAGYRQAAAEMASILAQRYGQNEHISHWQIDNEYGCHDTVLSYSEAALGEFRRWLENKYQSIENLNHCWGNVFWSMEYSRFDEIVLPNLTVTDPNPAHALDFRRFSSAQVIRFNRAQVEAIKTHSSKPLIHNYMGREFDVDGYQLNHDLDIAAWDSYPLGFLEACSALNETDKAHFYRQGDPDFQAFHHDLYRSVGQGSWWVMEQQSGPVNWAPWNPAPLPGMVRLWSWEAIAHGAEAVCYFRWRQAPFAQEQMHSGLLGPDSQPGQAHNEVQRLIDEIAASEAVRQQQSHIAIVFDYVSAWAWQVQPQGASFDYFELLYDFYSGLRQLGLSIDFVSSDSADLNDYKLVLIPGLMCWNSALRQALEETGATVLIGPRTGSKTTHFSIPDTMPPGIPGLDCKVSYVESLRPGAMRSVSGGGAVQRWLERLGIVDKAIKIEASVGGQPLWINNKHLHYLAGWPDQALMQRLLLQLCERSGIATQILPRGVRMRTTASHQFIFNYNDEAVSINGEIIEAAGVVWR